MKILGTLGEVNFLDHGGTVVFEPTGYSQIDAIHFEPDGDDDAAPLRVNSYRVERRKLVHDEDGTPYYVPAAYDETWRHHPSQYGEWWDKHLAGICSSFDVTAEEFRRLETSENPLENAAAMELVGQYGGFHELSGGEETVEPRSKWRSRLALPLYQAHKAGRI